MATRLRLDGRDVARAELLVSALSDGTEVVMRRSALILAIGSLAGVLSIGAVSNVSAAARVHPAGTTCSVFNGYSVLLDGQAVCGYGSGSVTNSGTIQWANGQTSTLSGPGTETQISDRQCPAVAGDTLSEAVKTTGGTVASGPLAGSRVWGKICLYIVNSPRLPPGTGYFQNLGIFHL
jgi:hypothetical protein